MLMWTPFFREPQITRKSVCECVCVSVSLGLGLAVLLSHGWRRTTTEISISATLHTLNRHGLNVGAVKKSLLKRKCVCVCVLKRTSRGGLAGGGLLRGEARVRGGKEEEEEEDSHFHSGLRCLPFWPASRRPAACRFGFGGSGNRNSIGGAENIQPFIHPSFHPPGGEGAAAAASPASLALCSDSRTAAARWR